MESPISGREGHQRSYNTVVGGREPASELPLGVVSLWKEIITTSVIQPHAAASLASTSLCFCGFSCGLASSAKRRPAATASCVRCRSRLRQCVRREKSGCLCPGCRPDRPRED